MIVTLSADLLDLVPCRRAESSVRPLLARRFTSRACRGCRAGSRPLALVEASRSGSRSSSRDAEALAHAERVTATGFVGPRSGIDESRALPPRGRRSPASSRRRPARSVVHCDRGRTWGSRRSGQRVARARPVLVPACARTPSTARVRANQADTCAAVWSCRPVRPQHAVTPPPCSPGGDGVHRDQSP